MTDQELKDLVAGLASSIREIREAHRESNKEISIQMEKTDKQIKETDKQMKETDKQMKETDRKLKSIGIQLGNMSKNQGDIAEEYFANSLKETLKLGNLNFDLLLTNVGFKTKKINDEFDILLVNGESVAIIEVKYKVHLNDLNKLPKKIQNLKNSPQYKNYKIYAGIAGFYVPNEVLTIAKGEGYFVLQRKGNIIKSFTENMKAA
jgi:Sec-independent protein translocase protein TatA